MDKEKEKADDDEVEVVRESEPSMCSVKEFVKQCKVERRINYEMIREHLRKAKNVTNAEERSEAIRTALIRAQRILELAEKESQKMKLHIGARRVEVHTTALFPLLSRMLQHSKSTPLLRDEIRTFTRFAKAALLSRAHHLPTATRYRKLHRGRRARMPKTSRRVNTRLAGNVNKD